MSKQIIEKILALKKNRKAVILAHNYQEAEVQDIADFTGDSLGLSIEASKTKAEVIVFCGVKFMAETAVILCPEKTVLLPDINAGCPMADMISAEELRELKKKHPNAAVVCYVNSTAEVKAESDYCCTSSNAVEVVNSLPEDKEIIFVPDQHLGRYVAEQTEKNLILWPGYCTTHIVISEDDIRKARQKYPDAMVLVHPECSESVKALADRIFSTGQMLKFAGKSGLKRFIIGTETGIIHALKKVGPDAEYIAASENAICPNMKRINLEKVLWSLEDNKYKITVPEEIRIRAKNALDRMIQIQV
jgi:quinolinate synthase